MALWGMCLQGAKGPQSGETGGGRVRSAATAAREEEDGVKTGPEPNPSLPLPPSLPSFSHTDTNSLKTLLPEVLLTLASQPRGS